MTDRRRPTPPRPTARGPRRRTALVLALALASLAGAVGLVGSPYAPVGDALLDRLHATPVPCPLGDAAPAVCFVVAPARASDLAEVLAAFVDEHGGALVHGDWSSGNGAYRVTLHWADDAWGGLEVWLAEQGEARVEGRLEHVPRRR